MPLDAPNDYGDTATVCEPGDLPRHPKTGAPQVTDPAKTRQPQGKKDELIAKCEARGIAMPAKVTIPQLKELLGPEMALSFYGRPSSLGKQIENQTNLQKWSERAVALGLALDPSIVDEVAALDLSQLTLDDGDARGLLDTAARRAKSAAQAGIAADRGTHTHATTEDFDTEADWIERATHGEDLGIPHAAQAALVAAWETMLRINGLEILHTEAVVVDDAWRQAGTLDRIARLTKDLRFVINGGEVVIIKAGTVVVLDIKTGKLRCANGIVAYWQGYAVQVASYAQSLPYDPETGLRGEWGFDIAQDYALIAHLDVLAALDGAATCRLVLVDLAAGREAGERCVWARSWERRRDVFSLVTDEDDTIAVVKVATSVTPDDVAAAPPDFSPEVEQQSAGSVVAEPDPALELANSVDRWGYYDVRVAGVTFAPNYPSNLVAIGAAARLRDAEGEPPLDCQLIRNPDNEHDANAIEVHVIGKNRTAMVGHINAKIASQLAPLIDGGEAWTATVMLVAFSPENPEQPGIEIRLRPPGVALEHNETVAAEAAYLANDIGEWGGQLKKLLVAEWPTGVPTPKKVRAGEATWDAEQLERVRAAVDVIVGPFDDPPVPPQTSRFAATATPRPEVVDGGPAHADDITALVEAIKASPVRDIVNAWLAESAEAGCSWSVRRTPRMRHYEVTVAAFRLAEIDTTGTVLDWAAVRTILVCALGTEQAEHPTNPIGVLLAQLTIDQARSAAVMALALTRPDTGETSVA